MLLKLSGNSNSALSIFLNKMPYLSGLKDDHTFNYDHLFTHVKNLIKHADISVALQETVFYIDRSGKKKSNYHEMIILL